MNLSFFLFGSKRTPTCSSTAVYVTRNSAYHARNGIVVSVVSSKTGAKMPDHPAVGARIEYGAKVRNHFVVVEKHPVPRVGDKLSLETRNGPLLTSEIQRIDTSANPERKSFQQMQ